MIEGEDSVALCKAGIGELLAVVTRKFDGGREELARIAVFLADLGEIFEATESWSARSRPPRGSS